MWRGGALLSSLLLILVSASACGSASSPPSHASPKMSPHRAPSFPRAVAIIATHKGPVLIHLLVADTPARRRYGLMGRSSLPEAQGMAFIFFQNSRASFYMRDIRIPLSIAFFDVNGQILSIMNTAPCDHGACRPYNPGVAYRGALEVNRGAFTRWGVSVGDTIQVAQ
jgi:uncharacterized protein